MAITTVLARLYMVRRYEVVSLWDIMKMFFRTRVWRFFMTRDMWLRMECTPPLGNSLTNFPLHINNSQTSLTANISLHQYQNKRQSHSNLYKAKPPSCLTPVGIQYQMISRFHSSPLGRKGMGSKISEALTPESSKSQSQKTKEGATDIMDKGVR